ncbi:MAG: hypothetical protein QOH05_3540 [Acetobacteraceae bacterium]|jgi:hypothetical protein|nr:hypothetical protein [Acetobacteraceae bacterium]
MFSKSRSLLLAATLMAAPLATAMAQQNNPAGNMGSNNSVTATPGTADSKSMSGMNTGDAGSRGAAMSNYGGSSTNNTAAGSTGHAVVPGSTSSQADASSGTAQQKTGSQTTGGK